MLLISMVALKCLLVYFECLSVVPLDWMVSRVLFCVARDDLGACIVV